MRPARSPQCHEARVKLFGARRIASLGSEAGLLTWKSSPHVMFLAALLAGIDYLPLQ